MTKSPDAVKNRAEFVKKMIKKKLRDAEIDHIMPFIEDTLRYLEGETEEHHEIN